MDGTDFKEKNLKGGKEAENQMTKIPPKSLSGANKTDKKEKER